MEKLKLLLDFILVELRGILDRNEGYMLSWDAANLKNAGDALIKLAEETYSQLAEVEHRVLHHSLRDAGLGMRMRAVEIQTRQLNKKDKEYFRDIHEGLEGICKKIETGEYYRALIKVRNSKHRS